MKEEEILNVLRIAISRKFGPLDFLSWKNEDYTRLSDEIFTETKILLSADTLKRLFGKKKVFSEKASLPSPSTRDALVRYLGFNNWTDFLRSLENIDANKQKETKQLVEKNQFVSSNYIYYLIGFIGVLLVVFILLKIEKNDVDIQLKVFNNEGDTPLHVHYNYNLSGTNDSVILNLGYNNDLIFKFSDNISLSKQHYDVYHSYLKPDYYKFKILKKGEIIDSGAAFAKSDRWWALAGIAGERNEAFQPLHKEGMITMDPKVMQENGFNNILHYVTEFRYFNDLKVSADSCIVNCRVQNNLFTGGKSCYDIWIDLVGENAKSVIQFLEPGCGEWVRLVIADNILEGRFTDLSKFGVRFEKFKTVTIKTFDGTIEIFVEGEFIARYRYDKKMGKLKGIKVKFKSIGQLDFAEVKNIKGETVYREDF